MIIKRDCRMATPFLLLCFLFIRIYSFYTTKAVSVIKLYTAFQSLEEIGQVTLYIVEIKYSVTSHPSSGISEKRSTI